MDWLARVACRTVSAFLRVSPRPPCQKKLPSAAQNLPPVARCSVDADSSISDAFYIQFTSQTPSHESCATAVISTIDYVLFSQVKLMNDGDDILP